MLRPVRRQKSHLPNTWHWWLTSAVAMAWPIPEDTPVTTTTRSLFTITPRLSRGPSSYCERSHPDSSHFSCSSADAPAPGPARHACWAPSEHRHWQGQNHGQVIFHASQLLSSVVSSWGQVHHDLVISGWDTCNNCIFWDGETHLEPSLTCPRLLTTWKTAQGRRVTAWSHAHIDIS